VGERLFNGINGCAIIFPRKCNAKLSDTGLLGCRIIGCLDKHINNLLASLLTGSPEVSDYK
jgi:hypothetical protein